MRDFMEKIRAATRYSVETDAAMCLEQLEAGARSDDALVRIACAPLAGDMYFRGEGVPKDIQKGAKYWEMAAELGDAGCMMRLGDLYAGQTCHQDYEAAIRYYRMASELGVAEAYTQLGICAYNGVGMEKDGARALACFDRARELGDERAELYAAYVNRHGQ